MNGTEEEWRPLSGHEERYEASSQGRIRSKPRTTMRSNGRPFYVRGRTLAQRPGRNPDYLAVDLNSPSGARSYNVHRLIAETFIPNPDNLPFVLHGANGSLDNSVENLRWGDQKQNMADRLRDGTDNRSLKSQCAKGHTFDELNTAWRKGVRKCKQCARDWSRLARIKRKEQGLPPGDPRHGTLTGYTIWVCRCRICQDVKNEYDAQYRERKRNERRAEPGR